MAGDTNHFVKTARFRLYRHPISLGLGRIFEMQMILEILGYKDLQKAILDSSKLAEFLSVHFVITIFSLKKQMLLF